MTTIMPMRQKESRIGLNHFRPRTELPVVRHLIQARRAGVLIVAAAGGVLLAAGPALADVTVTPPTAVQGGAENLTFHVPNAGTSTITRVKLVIPDDTPVAELYPLSVDDWAPDITLRTLSTPLTSIHSGTPVTQVASAITWIAMPGKGIVPGQATDLSVSLGPLPGLSQMQFTLVPTYANGQDAAPIPPVVLKLRPGTAEEQAAIHAGHDATGTDTTGTDTTGTAQDPDAALFAQTVANANKGPAVWSIAGWVIAGLAGIGAIVMAFRRRKVDEPEAPAEPAESDEPKETVGAGAAKVTSWSYRDTPDE